MPIVQMFPDQPGRPAVRVPEKYARLMLLVGGQSYELAVELRVAQCAVEEARRLFAWLPWRWTIFRDLTGACWMVRSTAPQGYYTSSRETRRFDTAMADAQRLEKREDSSTPWEE